jgi:ribosomal-protein-alanine N-acetyltransferase
MHATELAPNLSVLSPYRRIAATHAYVNDGIEAQPRHRGRRASDPPTLRTMRLILEPVCLGDAARLHAQLFSQPAVVRFWENSAVKTIHEVSTRLEMWCQRWAQGLSWWSVTCIGLGAFVGAVGFGEKSATGEVEIAYLACERYWGQGYMTEAVEVACQLANTAVSRIYATVHPDNGASRRVLEKCGFRPDGPIQGLYGQERLVYRRSCAADASAVAAEFS